MSHVNMQDVVIDTNDMTNNKQPYGLAQPTSQQPLTTDDISHSTGLDMSSFPGALVRYYTNSRVAKVHHDCGNVTRMHTFMYHKLQLELFLQPTLWRCAVVECFGTAMNTYWSMTTVSSIANNPTEYFYPPLQIAIIHAGIISILILATARSSGGHLNSNITFATFCAGLCEFPRMCLYIPAQILGSIIAAYIFKSALPTTLLNEYGLGGCYLGTLSTLSGFIYELFFSLLILFVAFGIALDEAQRQVFGPIFGPLIIGLTQASIIYVSPALSNGPGYTGASCNPSRCIGPAIAFNSGASNSVTYQLPDGVIATSNSAQWIYWVAPFCAGGMISILYRTVPPAHMTNKIKL